MNIETRSPAWKKMAVIILLGLVTLMIYSNSFDCRLDTVDNKRILTKDPRITAFTMDNLRLIFTQNYYWPSVENNDLYRPLTTLSYQFNHSVLGNGCNPAGYHLMNLLLHWFNASLFLLFVHRLLGSLRFAALAALIFAAHPVATEAVTNIVGRADLLVVSCVLLCMHFHLNAVSAIGFRKFAWLLCMGIISVAGILCKESAVIVAAWIPLYDYIFRWPQFTGDFKTRLKSAWRQFFLGGYIAIVPMLLVFVLIRFWTTSKFCPNPTSLFDNPIIAAPFFTGWLTAAKVQGLYIKLLFWPRYLSCDYSYNQISLYGTGTTGQNLACWLLLVGIGALIFLAFRNRRSRPIIAFGILSYLLLMLPTSNFILPIGSIMADRFLYLPSMGIILLISWLLLSASKKVDRAFLCWLPVLFMVVGLGIRAHVRNMDWKNESSIWESAVNVSPDSIKTQSSMAALSMLNDDTEHGRELAMEYSQKALNIMFSVDLDKYPGECFIPLLVTTSSLYFDQASTRKTLGRFTESRELYGKSRDLLIIAAKYDRLQNEALSARLRKNGKPPDSIPDGRHPEIYDNLTILLCMLGQYQEALDYGKIWVDFNPLDPEAHVLLCKIYYNIGEPEEAVLEGMTAMLIPPELPSAIEQLGNAYCMLHYGKSPFTQQFFGGYRLDTKDPDVCATLQESWKRLDVLARKRIPEAEITKLKDRACSLFGRKCIDP